jgi:hypothetical protein
MAEVKGIDGLKQLVTGLFKIGEILAVNLKDGADGKDVSLILTQVVASPDVQTAFKGLFDGDVDEIKDLSWQEGVELGAYAVSLVPGLIKAATK